MFDILFKERQVALELVRIELVDVSVATRKLSIEHDCVWPRRSLSSSLALVKDHSEAKIPKAFILQLVLGIIPLCTVSFEGRSDS